MPRVHDAGSREGPLARRLRAALIRAIGPSLAVEWPGPAVGPVAVAIGSQPVETPRNLRAADADGLGWGHSGRWKTLRSGSKWSWVKWARAQIAGSVPSG